MTRAMRSPANPVWVSSRNAKKQMNRDNVRNNRRLIDAPAQSKCRSPCRPKNRGPARPTWRLYRQHLWERQLQPMYGVWHVGLQADVLRLFQNAANEIKRSSQTRLYGVAARKTWMAGTSQDKPGHDEEASPASPLTASAAQTPAPDRSNWDCGSGPCWRGR